jgi:uncharacterized surface protein with fasciclin (FAS1) repeats
MKKFLTLVLFICGVRFSLLAQGTLFNVFSTADQFKTFNSLLLKSGYSENLKMKGPYTIFAPTDDAFLELPEGLVVSLLNAKTREEKLELYDFVKHYIFEGYYTVNDLRKVTSLKNIAGQEVKIESDFYGAKVNGIVIIQGDIKAKNGIAHSIGKCFYNPQK